MSVRSAQAITIEFTTSNPTTGAAVNADSTPTGTLVVNGTDNAASVTVTNVDTGRYKAAFTLPTLATGDITELSVAVTVSSVAGKAIIWRDSKDVLLDASGKTSESDKTGYALSAAYDAAKTAIRSIRTSTAQGGGAGSITLDTGASASDHAYEDCLVSILSGAGAGQLRLITDYNGATKVAVVSPNYFVNPDNTSVFEIVPSGIADVHSLNGNSLADGYLATMANDYNGGTLNATANLAAQTYLDIAETVRDVDNTSPAADSLGAAVNEGGATVAEIVAGLADSDLTVHAPVVGGTIILMVGCDYRIADGFAVRITLPAGAYPDITGATCYLGVTKVEDNSGGFTISQAALAGHPTNAQTIDFAPSHDSDETGALDPGFDYRANILIVYPTDVRVEGPEYRVLVKVNRVTIP